MESESHTSYFYNGEELFTVPTTVLPEHGEEIWINTLMDEDWFKVNFPNMSRAAVKNGIHGKFKVTSISRSYKTYDKVLSAHPELKFKLPGKKIIETFDVTLKLIKLIGEDENN